MSRIWIPTAAVLLAAISISPALAVDPPPPLERCQALLNQAEAASRVADPGTSAAERFRQAFEVCPSARELDLETGAHLAALRGRFLYVHEKEHQDAIAYLEDSLGWVTARGGSDYVGRIELLEALAGALGSALVQDLAPPAEWLRVEDLYQEALRVRKAVYVAESVEVVRGLLLLSAFHLDRDPEQAEGLARKAFELARAQQGLGSAPSVEALSMLGAALEAQGRLEELEETRELLATAFHEMDGERSPPQQ